MEPSRSDRGRVRLEPRGSARQIPLVVASVDGGRLNVPYYAQQMSNWCWAACIQMVAAYRNVAAAQCQGADALLGRNDCCPTNPVCNSTATADQCRQLYARLGFAGTGAWTYPFSFPQVQTGIGANNPIQPGLTFPTHKHMVVLIGWTTDDTGRGWVLVHDPGDDTKGWMPYTSLLWGYGTGAWTDTVYGM